MLCTFFFGKNLNALFALARPFILLFSSGNHITLAVARFRVFIVGIVGRGLVSHWWLCRACKFESDVFRSHACCRSGDDWDDIDWNAIGLGRCIFYGILAIWFCFVFFFIWLDSIRFLFYWFLLHIFIAFLIWQIFELERNPWVNKTTTLSDVSCEFICNQYCLCNHIKKWKWINLFDKVVLRSKKSYLSFKIMKIFGFEYSKKKRYKWVHFYQNNNCSRTMACWSNRFASHAHHFKVMLFASIHVWHIMCIRFMDVFDQTDWFSSIHLSSQFWDAKSHSLKSFH